MKTKLALFALSLLVVGSWLTGHAMRASETTAFGEQTEATADLWTSAELDDEPTGNADQPRQPSTKTDPPVRGDARSNDDAPVSPTGTGEAQTQKQDSRSTDTKESNKQAGSAKRTTQNDDSAPQVSGNFVLLSNGRVIASECIKTDAGYRLNTGITFPHEGVQYVGQTFEDVYKYRLSKIDRNDLVELTKLLEWLCFQGKDQEDLIRRLARNILDQDPSNLPAQRSLRTIDEKKKRRIMQSSNPDAIDPSAYIAGFKRAHGSEMFTRFRLIEGVLLNRCGVGCHSLVTYKGAFKLYKPGHGRAADQIYAARNLESVVNAVNMSDPQNSKILYWSIQKDNHGTCRNAPFGGVNDRNFLELRGWVLDLAQSYNGADVVQRTQLQSGPQAVPVGNNVVIIQPNADMRNTASADKKPTSARPRLPGDDPNDNRSGFTPTADDDVPAPQPKAMTKRPASNSSSKPTTRAQETAVGDEHESTDANSSPKEETEPTGKSDAKASSKSVTTKPPKRDLRGEIIKSPTSPDDPNNPNHFNVEADKRRIEADAKKAKDAEAKRLAEESGESTDSPPPTIIKPKPTKKSDNAPKVKERE